MTLDEEILYAKQEKELNKQVASLMETLEYTDNSEESLLTLKYCETAETLREFNYEENIFNILKEEKKYDEISKINKIIKEAKSNLDSNELNIVLESYRRLAEAKIIIEKTLGRAMAYGGKDLEEYQERTGSSDARYERKAAERERHEMFKKAFKDGGEHLTAYQKKYNVSDDDYENEAEKYSNRK